MEPATAPIPRSLNETVAPTGLEKRESDGSQGFSSEGSRK